MKRSPRILVANLALIVLIAFLCFVLHPSEPSYQGRTLTDWLKSVYDIYSYPGANAEAVSAIHHFGSNAIPTLLNHAAAKDSSLKKALMKWNDKNPWISLRFSSQFDKHDLGAAGFYILGPDAQSAVPELRRLLKDDDESVRGTAALCLGWIGPAAQAAVPDLIKEFEHEICSATNQNFAAAFALGQIGPSAKAAIPALLTGLTNNSGQCQITSRAALINIHGISISPLLEELKDTARPTQCAIAMMVVRQCGTNAIAAVPWLISDLNCSNLNIQSFALASLGALHQEPERCVPAIAPFLTSKNDYLRENAIRASESFGKAAKPAVPALLRCLNDVNPAVRDFATNAVREIDPEAAAKAGIK